jgi:hypothetical protein
VGWRALVDDGCRELRSNSGRQLAPCLLIVAILFGPVIYLRRNLKTVIDG